MKNLSRHNSNRLLSLPNLALTLSMCAFVVFVVASDDFGVNKCVPTSYSKPDADTLTRSVRRGRNDRSECS